MPSYQYPVTSYQCPVTSAQLPVPSYQCPVPSYQLPVPSYQCPVTSAQLLFKSAIENNFGEIYLSNVRAHINLDGRSSTCLHLDDASGLRHPGCIVGGSLDVHTPVKVHQVRERNYMYKKNNVAVVKLSTESSYQYLIHQAVAFCLDHRDSVFLLLPRKEKSTQTCTGKYFYSIRLTSAEQGLNNWYCRN